MDVVYGTVYYVHHTGTYMYIRILMIVITDGSPLEFILLNDLLSAECMYVDVCMWMYESERKINSREEHGKNGA